MGAAAQFIRSGNGLRLSYGRSGQNWIAGVLPTTREQSNLTSFTSTARPLTVNVTAQLYAGRQGKIYVAIPELSRSPSARSVGATSLPRSSRCDIESPSLYPVHPEIAVFRQAGAEIQQASKIRAFKLSVPLPEATTSEPSPDNVTNTTP